MSVSNLRHAHNKGSQSTTGCANYATWPENASLRHVATAAMPNRCWTNSSLKDRDVQLKLLDVGPTITIDQAISTARTCETSKLLAEQLKTGASVQGIKSKSTYQRQKSVKVTAAAAAAVKTDAPTKPIGATKSAPEGIPAQPETRNAGHAKALDTSNPSARVKYQPSNGGI